MGTKRGLDAKLHYGPAGSTATTELTNVKDLSINLETDQADTTTRASNGWKSTVATLKDGSLEWEMIWNTEDAGFTAIKNAYFGSTPIALAALDGPNGQGLDADFSIVNFSRNEQLAEALTVSVTAKPTFVTRAPTWKE